MKRYQITAADETEEDTLDDKINDAKDDFEYIIDGLSQLDNIQANEILNNIHEFLTDTISSIAENLI